MIFKTVQIIDVIREDLAHLNPFILLLSIVLFVPLLFYAISKRHLLSQHIKNILSDIRENSKIEKTKRKLRTKEETKQYRYINGIALITLILFPICVFGFIYLISIEIFTILEALLFVAPLLIYLSIIMIKCAISQGKLFQELALRLKQSQP